MSWKQLPITSNEEGMRLDRFIQKQLGVNFMQAQMLARKGRIKLDGKRADGKERLNAGQQVQLAPDVTSADQAKPARTISDKDAAQMHRMVIYRDPEVLVLNKPAGLAVQGGSKITRSLDALLPALADGDEVPRLVHRLDRDTSGALLVARTAKSARLLADRFKQREMEKTYLAIISGVPEIRRGEIKLSLRKSALPGEKELMVVADDGQFAHSRYEVLDTAYGTEETQRMSVVALYPVTGRTHQLRVHMAAIGHPILGDGKYGAEAKMLFPEAETLQLHAWKIAIPKARQGDTTITAPPPPTMRKLARLFDLELPA